MRRSRGAGLATVLLVMAVLGALALTLAGSTTFHLRLATRQSQTSQARNLSESVLSMAVDRLADERSFGAGTTADTDNITVQFSADDPVGRLTFHAPQAQSWGVPVSVNNLENDASVVLPDGRTLPAFSAYLVAQAEYGGVPKLMESVITIPVYKYALATSGRVVSNGRLLVASIDSDTDLSGGLSAVPAADLKPGHLAAQSTSQTVLDSSSAANATLITGDVVSGGAVSLGAHTDVQGSVLQNHEPEELPDLEVTDYDPSGWTGVQTLGSATLNQPNPFDPVELSGVCRRQGDLDVFGELDLDGGYIYVDGDLTITGGITGKGSIFCTGDISVGNASSFSTDNVQAIVADGDISISGGNSSADRDSSFFNGILFGKGAMDLSNVTVVGSVVNNSSDSTAQIQLDNVGLLSNPETLHFDFGMPYSNRESVGGQNGDYQLDFIPRAGAFSQQYDPVTDSFASASQGDLEFSVYIVGDVGSWYDTPELVGHFSSAQGLWHHMNVVEPNLGGGNSANDYTEFTTSVNDFHTWFNNVVANIDDLYQETKQESLQRGEFTLEPNQFVPFEDRVRVIWSRER